jgi:hypothetical protein
LWKGTADLCLRCRGPKAFASLNILPNISIGGVRPEVAAKYCDWNAATTHRRKGQTPPSEIVLPFGATL